MSAELGGQLKVILDEIEHLQHCKDVLEDIYTQTKGKRPEKVEQYTWNTVEALVGE